MRIFVLLALIGAMSFAGEPVLTGRIDQEKAHLGDIVNLTVELHFEPGWDFDLKPLGLKLGDAVVQHSSWGKPEPVVGTSLKKLTLKAELSFFSLGAKVIPPIQVKAGKDGEKNQVLETNEIKLEIQPILQADDQNLSEAKPQKAMTEVPLWAWALGLLIVIALVIWVIWKKLSSKTEREEFIPPPLPPLEEVQLRLRELINSSILKEGRTKTFYVEISLIVRHFLGRVFDFPGEEMTSFEIEDHFRDMKLPDGFLDHQIDFNELCDRVKFAKYDPSEAENTQIVNLAYQVVQHIKPLCREEVANVEAG